MAAMVSGYSGIENLEAMEEAANYKRFLTGLIAQLARATKPGSSLLDFGAGVGTYAGQARALGCTVFCVEIDAGLRSLLTDRGFVTAADLHEVPDQSQRAIYSFNVLEHIQDDEAVIRDLFRVVTLGGQLLLYVPAFPVLFSAMDRHVGHQRRYRRRQLVSLVEGVGFKVDECVYADSLGFAASLAYRVLGRQSSGVVSPRSVRLYDRCLFPLSRVFDSRLQRWFGKNIVLTAHRPEIT
jgi:SAM-dependent methyltransferase